MKRLILFHVCGLLHAIGCGWLTWCSFWINPFAIQHEVYLFLLVIFFMAVAYTTAAYGIARDVFTIPLSLILFWAVVFRVLLLPSQPILETDWNRYLWDGYVSSQGMNPYQYPPALFLDTQSIKELPDEERTRVYALMDDVRSDEHAYGILQNVNNAEVNTIYPPMVQWLFLVTASIQPFSIVAWRCVILFFDGLLIYSLVHLLKHFELNPSMVIFYAWSPLVLKEYINTTHFDGIALSLFFLAVWLSYQTRFFGSAIIWACAVLTKFFPVVAVIFWLPVKQWKIWATFCITLMIFSLPFYGGESNFVGYAHFVQRWESNSSLVSFMEWGYGKLGVPAWNEGTVLAEFNGVPLTFDAFFLAKCTGVMIVALLFFLCLWNYSNRDPKQKLFAGFVLCGGILLCSPVANPWYIAWITPFLCFIPSIAWFYLSVLCFIYYTFFIGNQIGYSSYDREIEYIPFYLILLLPSFLKFYIHFFKPKKK